MKTRLLATQSDEQLLALARLGSEQAFESLANRCQRPLRRHCRQLCLSDAHAEAVVQRTLAEAWSGISGGAEFEDLRAWMHQIAQRHAAEAMSQEASTPVQEQALEEAASPSSDVQDASVEQAPRPDEVLALRGALAAMSPRRAHRSTIVKIGNGNKAHLDGDAGLEIAGIAFRGLIGRTRRGISALTPAPLLAWAIGRASQGSSTVAERFGEVGASGGTAGLTGLAIKGGIAAIGAGVAITGSVMIAKPGGSHAGSRHAAHRAASRLVATRPSPGTDHAIAHGLGTSQPPASVRSHGRRSAARRDSGASKLSLARPGQSGATTQKAPAGTVPAAHTTPTSTRSGAQQGAGSGHQNAGDTGAGTESSAASNQAGATPSTPSAPSSSSSASGQDGNGQSEGQGAAGQGGNNQGGDSQGGESGSGTTSGQSAPPIGVHVSLESGSSGSGEGSSAGGSSGSSESQGPGVGVSISLGPIGSVGVHVSLP